MMEQMEPGALLPFELRRGRDTIVALVHQGCDRCAGVRRSLAGDDRVAAADAALLVVPTDGEARVVISDRYGKIWRSLPIHGPAGFSAAAEALDWIDFVQMQCPECGVPEW